MDEGQRAMLIEYAQFHEDQKVRELGRELERLLKELKLANARRLTSYVIQEQAKASAQAWK